MARDSVVDLRERVVMAAIHGEEEDGKVEGKLLPRRFWCDGDVEGKGQTDWHARISSTFGSALELSRSPRPKPGKHRINPSDSFVSSRLLAALQRHVLLGTVAAALGRRPSRAVSSSTARWWRPSSVMSSLAQWRRRSDGGPLGRSHPPWHIGGPSSVVLSSLAQWRQRSSSGPPGPSRLVMVAAVLRRWPSSSVYSIHRPILKLLCTSIVQLLL
uniref:Uncharacterized protein n=1 Tax=Oryza sativa subsp. japonica TaxID=39947 RepID=Q6YVQ9_ORYSJ|nr:hypothetical protein [Oryza sativa Japonica Group]